MTSTTAFIIVGAFTLAACGVTRWLHVNKHKDKPVVLPDPSRKQFDVMEATKGPRLSDAYKKALERDRKFVADTQGMHERMKETLKVQPRQHRNGGGV